MKVLHIATSTISVVCFVGIVGCPAAKPDAGSTPLGLDYRPTAIAQADVLKEVYARLKDLEKQNFGTVYEMDVLTQRLDRLEKKVFGSTQSGNPRARLDRLLLTAGDSPSSRPSVDATSGSSGESSGGSSAASSSDSVSIPARTQTKADFGPYEADLARRIKRAWFPPKDAGDKRVKLAFKIANDGALSDLKLETPSGATALDSSTLKAVENASPFRPLPSGSPEQVSFSCSLSGKDVFAYVQLAESTSKTKDIDLIPVKDYMRKQVQGTDFTAYFESAITKIKTHWNASETASKPVAMGFHIAKTGEIQDLEVVEESGSSAFDSGAKQALQSAKHLGALPATLKEKLWAWAVFDGKNKEILVGVPQDIDYGPYMSAMQKKIKDGWNPPKSHRSKRVTVQFKVVRSGQMSAFKVTGSSGTAAADNAALKAAQNANPLPRLPRGSPPDVDIQFTFDPSSYCSPV